MCGRFELHSALEIIAQVFGLRSAGALPTPSYNITPGRDIAIIVSDGAGRHLTACRWGFLPPWAKDEKEGHKMINARAETVAEKPSFREAFGRHRCLVVADGFYEWKAEGGKRKPVYVRLRSGRPFGMAGLYNQWIQPSGEPVCTCTIITTAANDLVSPYHDRMPALMAENDIDLWLAPEVLEAARLMTVLRPYPAGELELYEVTPKVFSPKNDSAENIERLRNGQG